MSLVYQLLPVLEGGDAISNHALRMARILGERHGGFIVERADPVLGAATKHWSEARVDPDDILIYHVALASQVGEWMKRAKAKKVIDYHNVTPAEFFRPYELGLSAALTNARYELEALRHQVTLALADSDYSRRELEDMGFENTRTLPILIDFSDYDRPGNTALMEKLNAGKSRRGDIVFVGRIAPNKRHEDLIKAFTVYRRTFNPEGRLFLVGGTNSDSYSRVLAEFVDRLGIEEVHFVGRVSVDDLVAYYRVADVFLSMSEHEGFGVPWLEAMHFGLPVLTFDAAAVPETTGGGGVLFRQKRYDEVAALVDVVMRDEEVRRSLVEAGRRRLGEMKPEQFGEELRRLLEDL